MLHACAARFDLTGNLEKFYELNKASVFSCFEHVRLQSLSESRDSDNTRQSMKATCRTAARSGKLSN